MFSSIFMEGQTFLKRNGRGVDWEWEQVVGTERREKGRGNCDKECASKIIRLLGLI